MHNRREFLAGAAATGAGLALPVELADAAGTRPTPHARPVPVRRGRAIAVTPDGRRLVVAHAGRRTIAIVGKRGKREIDVGGQPLEVAISPDGKLAAVTTAFWDAPGLALVELASGRKRRIDVGPAPFGAAFTDDGARLVVTGGEQEGTAQIVDVRRGVVLTRVAVGKVPRGLALGGHFAWIALNGDHTVARLDLRTGRVTRRFATPDYPDRLALSPDAHRLLITHGGRQADEVSELNVFTGAVDHGAVGRQPSAVAWTKTGKRVIALGGTSELLVIDRDGHRRRRRKVAPAPRGLALAGARVFTVSALTGAISEVRA